MANTIAVSAVFEAQPLRRGIAQVNTQLNSFQRGATKVGKAIRTGLLTGVAVLGLNSLSSALHGVIAEARESQKVTARTANVIKTTGGVANVSAKEVGNLANAVSLKTGIDDEAIQSGSNLLLTFKNIRNEAGAGRKIFNLATKAAVDLSAAGFGSITGASKQLGKALNDPIKGITALARAGVTFSKQQIARIKTYVTEGKQLKAQQIILKEVNSQVGGAAAAQATAGEKLKVSIDNVKERIGLALLPTLDKAGLYLADKLPGWIDTSAAAFHDLADSAEAVRSVVEAVPSPLRSLIVVLGLSVVAMRLATTATESVSNAVNNRLRPAYYGALASVTQANKQMLIGRGAALAAGAALVTLSNGANSSSSGMTKVASVAGSAAAGFAVAGPWGAVAGAGVALLGVGKQSEESARRQQAFLDMQRLITGQASTLTATLNKQSGAITALTRKTVIKNLADNGAFTAANKVGISYSVVTKAALGNKTAQAQVNTAVQAYKIRAAEAAQGALKQGEAYAKADQAAKPLTTSVKSFSTSLSKAKSATNQTNTAIQQMSEEAHDAATAMHKAGSDAGRGFATGISAWFDPIRAIGAKLADLAAKAARDKLKVKSPSRVFQEIGHHTAEGFILGITAQERSARAAVQRITDAAAAEARRATIPPIELSYAERSARSFLTDPAASSAALAVQQTVNINVKFDNKMTEAEMGASYDRALRAARRQGLIRS